MRILPVLPCFVASFQKEKATYEFDLAQLRSRVRQLESSMSIKQEQVYNILFISLFQSSM